MCFAFTAASLTIDEFHGHEKRKREGDEEGDGRER